MGIRETTLITKYQWSIFVKTKSLYLGLGRTPDSLRILRGQHLHDNLSIQMLEKYFVAF